MASAPSRSRNRNRRTIQTQTRSRRHFPHPRRQIRLSPASPSRRSPNRDRLPILNLAPSRDRRRSRTTSRRRDSIPSRFPLRSRNPNRYRSSIPIHCRNRYRNRCRNRCRTRIRCSPNRIRNPTRSRSPIRHSRNRSTSTIRRSIPTRSPIRTSWRPSRSSRWSNSKNTNPYLIRTLIPSPTRSTASHPRKTRCRGEAEAEAGEEGKSRRIPSWRRTSNRRTARREARRSSAGCFPAQRKRLRPRPEWARGRTDAKPRRRRSNRRRSPGSGSRPTSRRPSS